MTTQDNISVIKEAYEAFKIGNVQAALARIDDNVVWITPGQKDLIPFATQLRGRRQLAQYLEALALSEILLTFEPREFVAEGDSVVVFFSYRVYAKATGRAKEGDGVHLFHFLGGKIAALREFLDVTATPAYRADLLPEMTMNDPVHCKFCG